MPETSISNVELIRFISEAFGISNKKMIKLMFRMTTMLGGNCIRAIYSAYVNEKMLRPTIERISSTDLRVSEGFTSMSTFYL